MASAKCTKCGTTIKPEPGATSLTCSGCGKTFRLHAAASTQGAFATTPPPPPANPKQTPSFQVPSPRVWFYIDDDGQQKGLVSTEALIQLLKSGDISATTLVWKEGMTEWQPAQKTELARSTPREGPVFVDPADNQHVRDAGRMAYDEVKNSISSAMNSIKVLFSDPMGGQDKCLGLLGDSRAMQAGIVFIVAFSAACLVAAQSVISSFGTGPSGRSPIPDLGFEEYAKLFIVSLIPAVSLVAGFMVIGKVFGGRTAIRSSVFTAGVDLLPVTLAVLVSWLSGIGNIELVLVVWFLCVCVSILLLNASLVDVQKLSTRKALILTPLLIMITAYITKLLITRLFQP